MNEEKTKLKVYFGFIGGNYWILDLDDDYSRVMIGEPCRKLLWILSREEYMEPQVLEELKGKAAALGYKVDDLKYRTDFD